MLCQRNPLPEFLGVFQQDEFRAGAQYAQEEKSEQQTSYHLRARGVYSEVVCRARYVRSWSWLYSKNPTTWRRT